MSEPPIEARDLAFRFGEVRAVDGVSFEVRRGEMFGLIGPDGAGKTTTLRMVLGLLPPERGAARTCGLEPTKERRALSRRVGYLAQRFSLYGDLSVDENVAFFARVHGVRGWRRRRDELLDLLRMTPFRRRIADALSGGMKQKLALLCTLIHTPEVLVLDEPTTGVDPVSRRDFWSILSRLQRDGMTILLTTPYLDEAERCRRVALIDRGKILVSDAPDALRTGMPGVLLEVIAKPRDAAREIVGAVPGVADVEVFGERLHAALPEAASGAADAAAAGVEARLREAGLDVALVRIVVPSLEDVFIRRIRETRGGDDRAQEVA